MSYISAYTTGNKVVVWERTDEGRVTKEYVAPWYFYAENPKGKHKSIFGPQLSKITCESREDLKKKVMQAHDDGFLTYESDLQPDLKILAQHYYDVPAPKLHVTFFDIEVDYDPLIGFSSTTDPYAPINAIAIHHHWKNTSIVFAVPPPNWNPDSFDESLRDLSTIHLCRNEKELLQMFLKEIEDSDALSGWNSKLFDIPYIVERVKKTLGDAAMDRLSFPNCGKNTLRREELELFGKLQLSYTLRGRIHLDYMDLFKKYEMDKRATYKLEAIADEILPHLPKLKYEGSLASLYHNDFNHFVRYNIRDTEILKGFEDRLGYVDLANVMYHSATGTAQQVTGTIRLVDLSIVNYCHNVLNVKVPDWVSKPDGNIAGAMVLFPQIGLHDYMGSVDINSLYPSAIRSINISPETMVGQFTGRAKDWELITKQSEEIITFEYLNGDIEERPAYEWREQLLENKWAVSGYGTVFDQNKQGVIPALLENWYALRKEYQKKKAQAYEAAEKAGKDTPEGQEWMQKYTYYDRLQYVYKIKLNSTYGALTNFRFRFFDLRTGESTTGTGRQILKHQVRKIAELLDGNYNVDFPQYNTVADALEKDASPDLALHGPVFKGQFQSPSILYGDTDSCYFKTGGTNNEEAIMLADHIANLVNKSFQEFMQDNFLCQPEFDNLIKAGREAVSDHGIFVDKKRYVLHLVNLDGKDVDKLKVMGLEMRKTTTPKPIQNFLKDVVSMILSGKDWNDINQFIVKYRDDVAYNMDLLDIGLPKGCNKLDEYVEKHRLVRDENGKKYTIPGQVAAAIHYNQLLEHFKDKENSPIMSGSRVRVYYLERPVNGFKSIALPVDADWPPQWFLDHVEVDRKEQAQKLIDNNLGHIFKAIGREVPTHQTLLFNSLFSY